MRQKNSRTQILQQDLLYTSQNTIGHINYTDRKKILEVERAFVEGQENLLLLTWGSEEIIASGFLTKRKVTKFKSMSKVTHTHDPSMQEVETGGGEKKF